MSILHYNIFEKGLMAFARSLGPLGEQLDMCMCMYVCMYVYICMWPSGRTAGGGPPGARPARVGFRANNDDNSNVCIYIYIYIFRERDVYMHICNVYIYIYIYICIYIYIHTC